VSTEQGDSQLFGDEKLFAAQGEVPGWSAMVHVGSFGESGAGLSKGQSDAVPREATN